MMIRLLVILAVMLVGCAADPVATAKTDNPGVTASIIATIDGCNVYRVYDGNSQKIYFVRCPTGMTQTSWDVLHSTGKSAYTEHFRVDTDTR